MRTIDALAITLGLIACLAMSHSGVQPSADEIAAETWMLEQDMVGLLHTMSSPALACYDMTLPSAEHSATGRVAAMLASTCDPTLASQLT